MPTRRLVVFDGDDTLWRTQELYDEIKAKFLSLVGAHGFTSPDLRSVLDQIDAEAAQTRGFTVERFVDSMVETYRRTALGRPRHPAAQLELEIRELAQPLLGDYQLYPDTLPVLKRLKTRFELVLATKGERALQEQKVNRLHLAHYFTQLYFVERKTEAEYLRILQAHAVHADSAWAVGNSVRSDVNPALRIGMHAIWIRRPTWLYEEATLEQSDVPVADSLTEAAEMLLALDAGQHAIGVGR